MRFDGALPQAELDGSDAPTGRRLAALAALFVTALALRPHIVGVGPVLPDILTDLGIGHGVGGLVGTLPVLCMGALAPAAPLLVGRWGTRTATGAALLLIAGAGVARATSTGGLSLAGWTLLVGVGIGVAGALMPVTVKERFADRPAAATGVYAAGIQLGAAISAGVAVPLSTQVGDWRGVLVVFSLAAAGSAIAWLLAVPRRLRVAATGRVPRLPWRSQTAWLIAAVFAFQGIPYYGLNAWLPAHLQETGWSAQAAGASLAVFNVAALVATLSVPSLVDRWGSRRTYLVTCSTGYTVAMAALVVHPALANVWAAVIGMTLGTMFVIALTLPLDVSPTPAKVGATSGLVLMVGYGTAALTPLWMGALRDLAGSFSIGLLMLVGVGVVLILMCLPLSSARLHRGV